MTKTLWEVLVPRFSNEKKEFPLEHHKQWDEEVRVIAGGVTILRTAKGHWVNPEGKIFVEEMIPVRVYCTEEEVERIMDYTRVHYSQEAVMAYLVSEKVKIRPESFNPTE